MFFIINWLVKKTSQDITLSLSKKRRRKKKEKKRRKEEMKKKCVSVSSWKISSSAVGTKSQVRDELELMSAGRGPKS